MHCYAESGVYAESLKRRFSDRYLPSGSLISGCRMSPEKQRARVECVEVTSEAGLGPFPQPLLGEDESDFLVRCFAHFGRVAYNLKREFSNLEGGDE